MTPADIPFVRLNNQQISSARFSDPAKVVAALGAVQAQDYAAAKWALGLRLKNATDNKIEAAFTKGAILRTHVMRPTWHFVAPQDIRWMQELTAPRVINLLNTTGKKIGLDEAVYKRSNKLIQKVLTGGRYLTRTQIGEILEKNRIAISDLRMIHIMMRAELECLICSGPRQGKQFTYALLAERAPGATSLSREKALTELAFRYFSSHGPATVADFAWWSGLTLKDSSAGIGMVKSKFSSQVIEGKTFWFPKGVAGKTFASKEVWLLPNYDEYTVAYQDRSAIIEDHVSKASPRGHVIFNYAIVYKGRVIGTWVRTVRKNDIELKTSLFVKSNKTLTGAISDAVDKYASFMGVPVKWVK